jgi:hypothetical protein
VRHLSDGELDQLLQDAGKADKRLRPLTRDYEPLQPRITRLLEEQRTLRDQTAEASHMAAMEGDI